MTETVSNPHDAFFKHYLGQLEVARDFLRQHLPVAVSEVLDWQQLRLEKDSFVDEQLRSYFSDLIYSTMTNTATPMRIALLAEHKSYPDEWVDFQVLRYQVGYWVRELEAIQAAVSAANSADGGKPRRVKRQRTLTPILVVLVYHGVAEWRGPLRFARHLAGLEDPTSPLAQVLGRYVPDFEPHFVNLSMLADEALRGAVTTRLLVTVLKYIFSEGLGGRLDEVLRLASEVLQQPTGLEMVLALLRYISQSAVNLDKAEIAQKLLTYLPQEGGVLMETLAQQWIQEGIDIGKKEGIDIGKLAAQRQTVLHLLQWRFAPTAEEAEAYAAQLARITNFDHLVQLIDHLLTAPTLVAFAEKLRPLLPLVEETPAL